MAGGEVVEGRKEVRVRGRGALNIGVPSRLGCELFHVARAPNAWATRRPSAHSHGVNEWEVWGGVT